MTDLEVCKRIAEIEGIDFEAEDGKVIQLAPNTNIPNAKVGYFTSWFNPLTDKALCFNLMVKYRVDIVQSTGGNVEAHCWGGNTLFGADDEVLQRAICLAIIAKHEDKDNE